MIWGERSEIPTIPGRGSTLDLTQPFEDDVTT